MTIKTKGRDGGDRATPNTSCASNVTEIASRVKGQRCANCGTSCTTGLCVDCQNWERFHQYVTAAARIAREVK